MTAMFFLGFALVIFAIIVLGALSGRKVKNAGDFAKGGRKAGAAIITGSLVGTMVGGASTIGTAQLAFSYGFSAWWYTLGSGLSCLFLALFFVKPLYCNGADTLPEIFSKEYGHGAASFSVGMMSIGNVIGIIGQMVSGIALVGVLCPIPPLAAVGILFLLMLVYVAFGGIWGTGYVGILKILLLYALVVLCGIIALVLQGGSPSFWDVLPHDRYFNLFARGLGIDLGSFFSLLVGIVSSQTYVQTLFSGKTLKASRTGALAGALLIPPIGVAGIFVGMYMKLHHPETAPVFALPMFVIAKLPPLIAGMILATLLITLVGAGAGLALGIGTMISNDIYKVYINPKAGDKRLLLINRAAIMGILFISAFLSLVFTSSIILDWSYLATGFRGTVVFLPLMGALFFPGKIPPRIVLVAMIAGPAVLVLGKILPLGFNSFFLGMLVNLLILISGYMAGRRK
ncbi:sodium:solute symporter family protein [Treponema primitia]|uniref:sodium:solute symporter family protein n=1 Tax=Treponema primitia TaxID=88058 RepID=UPI00397FA332